MSQTWAPDWAVSAGEIIQERLTELRMSQAECAIRCGISTKHLNRLVKGRAYFSADMAIRLERVLATSADLLMRMQADYQLHLARYLS